MASWSDGDGAGMCMRSYWPNVSVSAQVVGVSGRGARGSLGSGRSAGCAIGEGRTSPRLGAMAGICSGRIPGGLHALAWLPVPLTTRRNLPAGFAPARTAINVPPQAPIEVPAYLVSARRRVQPSSTDLVFRDDARLGDRVERRGSSKRAVFLSIKTPKSSAGTPHDSSRVDTCIRARHG